MQKYQYEFIKRLKNKVEQWNKEEKISNQELYHFLHSIKGTAESIGLQSLTKTASELIQIIDENNISYWQRDNWKAFIAPITVQLQLDSAIPKETKKMEYTTELIQIENENNPLILLVDNDVEMLKYIKRFFEPQGWSVLIAVNIEKAITIFYNNKVDCILLGKRSAEHDWIKEMNSVLARTNDLSIPLIILSDEDSKEDRIEAYSAGALDYISKYVEVDELISRVRNKLHYRDKLRSSILFDELTGAYKQYYLKSEVKQFIENYDPTGSQTMALIDIDNFDSINNEHGYHFGDEVLRSLSRTIKDEKLHSDIFIRYVGDKFILFMPGINEIQAKMKMERIQTLFSSKTFNESQAPFSCTFSAGVYQINDAKDRMETLLTNTKMALMQAKAQGGNTTVIHNAAYAIDKEPTNKYLRIGIIDDDPVIHSILSEYLKSFTFNEYTLDIRSFREGESFFNDDWYKQNGKYIILLDGIMPRMDGFEVLQRIRKECPDKDFLVIIISGRKGEKDIIRGLELGADDYITKPFNVKELEARIKRLAIRQLYTETEKNLELLERF